MKSMALLAYGLDLVRAFGLPSVVQRRHTGDTDLRLDAGTARQWTNLLLLARTLVGYGNE